MTEQSRPKKFLHIPHYIGGNKAFREFIRANLRYPKEALDAGIEGTVFLRFDVDDNGMVHNPEVLKGIGYGCDEEAVRLARMMKYEKVKNRGVRVKTSAKTKIRFKLPKQSIRYTVKPAKKPKGTPKENPSKPQKTYSYTVKF